MTIPSISDQVFAASEKFHKARIAYEVERDALRELEQQLLRYTEDYQALPEQAEYVGDGTWPAWGNTFLAGKNGPGPNCWVYVCNPTGKKPAYFQEAQEVVAFLAGFMVAEARQEEQERDATDLTVAT